MALMNSSSATNGDSAKVPAIKSDSKHFTSLQIFTSYAEPALDEYITQKEQTDLENKHREEEDKLYRFDMVAYLSNEDFTFLEPFQINKIT